MTDPIQRLLTASADEFVAYNLNGAVLTARALRVHDGDTITVGWLQDDRLVKTNLRLLGIDTPELHSKVEKEARLCRLGRNWLSAQVANKIVTVKCREMDKYGRLLGDIFVSGGEASLNQQMVDHKFARVYGGDLHKDAWADDDLEAGLARAAQLGIADA